MQIVNTTKLDLYYVIISVTDTFILIISSYDKMRNWRKGNTISSGRAHVSSDWIEDHGRA